MRKTWCTKPLKKGSVDYYRHLAGLEWSKGNSKKALELENEAFEVQVIDGHIRRQQFDKILNSP